MIIEADGKVTLKIEFANHDAAEHFAVWMTESGEQDYWEWMSVTEEQEDGPITARRFEYHVIKDASKPRDNPDRYGEFLGDNTIRTECGRISKSDDREDL